MEKMENVNVRLMYQGQMQTFRQAELRALREEAVGEMQQLVMELMDDRQPQRWRWRGTTTDLVEMVNDVYMVCDVKDGRGCALTFSYMVERVCHGLVHAVPRNPRSYAYRARMRKSMRQSALVDRWVLMKLHGLDPRQQLMTKALETM